MTNITPLRSHTYNLSRYHVHGSAGDATVTVSVDAVDEMDAQRQAWQVCPAMDVSEIEETA